MSSANPLQGGEVRCEGDKVLVGIKFLGMVQPKKLDLAKLKPIKVYRVNGALEVELAAGLPARRH
jgi:hypothetical protein